jgi:hypothetical protein
LNDEALEHSQQDFQKYFEKVVDAKLHFAPSPSECVDIALAKDTESQKLLADNCTTVPFSQPSITTLGPGTANPCSNRNLPRRRVARTFQSFS